MKTGLIVGIVLMLTCGFVISANAQKNRLFFEEDKATVKKTFSPRAKTDADIYTIYLRKYQLVEIKVSAKSFFLSEENECGMAFRLFNSQDKEVWLGDSVVGIDDWRGEIKTGGIYKIKVYADCLESFTSRDLRMKKPDLKYTLEITGSPLKTR